jgi:peptide deformylase
MRKISLYGQDVLRKRCRPLDPESDRDLVGHLLSEMQLILQEHDGLGLAGPQAGEPVRIFIAGADAGLPLGGHTVFINPEVLPSGPEIRGEEGCLSFPGVYADISRSQNVRITALDRNWKPFTLNLTGLASRLVQHESDHLDGVLLIDRMGPLKRRLLRNRLRSIREESC